MSTLDAHLPSRGWWHSQGTQTTLSLIAMVVAELRRLRSTHSLSLSVSVSVYGKLTSFPLACPLRLPPIRVRLGRIGVDECSVPDGTGPACRSGFNDYGSSFK